MGSTETTCEREQGQDLDTFFIFTQPSKIGMPATRKLKQFLALKVRGMGMPSARRCENHTTHSESLSSALNKGANSNMRCDSNPIGRGILHERRVRDPPSCSHIRPSWRPSWFFIPRFNLRPPIRCSASDWSPERRASAEAAAAAAAWFLRSGARGGGLGKRKPRSPCGGRGRRGARGKGGGGDSDRKTYRRSCELLENNVGETNS